MVDERVTGRHLDLPRLPVAMQHGHARQRHVLREAGEAVERRLADADAAAQRHLLAANGAIDALEARRRPLARLEHANRRHRPLDQPPDEHVLREEDLGLGAERAVAEETGVEAGALPLFIQLLASPNADVQESPVFFMDFILHFIDYTSKCIQLN